MTEAEFLDAVARYDDEAETGVWPGPAYRVRHRSLGNGPPLVLLPGLAATYRGYAPLLRILSREFRTVVFDYPGEAPDDGADLDAIDHDDIVDHVRGLALALGLERAFPLGVSFGSTIALKLLRHEPERFPGAVLQGGFARRPFRLAERVALHVGRRWFRGRIADLPLRDATLAILHRPEFPRDAPGIWRHYAEENAMTPIRPFCARLDMLKTLDLRPILPQIRLPVTLVQGDRDRLVGRERLRELVEGLPEARVRHIRGCGHQAYYTHTEELARIVAEAAREVKL